MDDLTDIEMVDLANTNTELMLRTTKKKLDQEDAVDLQYYKDVVTTLEIQQYLIKIIVQRGYNG